MIVSIGCALHCATITVVFMLYPTLWLNRRYWEIGLWQKLQWLEWGLLALAWGLVIVAMWLGWRRHHQVGPALLGLAGIVLMTVLITTSLHFSGHWTGAVALAAGLTIALAHWWNLRLA